MATSQQAPIAPDLFTWPSDEPRLLGSRCGDCGVHTFPRQHGCPRCSATDLEPVELGRRGTLWTWTTQGFRPKTPPYAGPESEESFEPYALGYVELPGELKVETRLVGIDPDRLRLGMEMELVVVPFRREGDTEIVSFAFRPVG